MYGLEPAINMPRDSVGRNVYGAHIPIPSHRSISTALVRASLAPDLPSDAEIALQEALAEQETLDKELLHKLESESSLDERRQPETYHEFMEAIGNNFKHADAPRKWLGGNEAVEFISPNSGSHAHAVS